MDVLCVREATKFAADHCRAGKVSARLHAHTMHSPSCLSVVRNQIRRWEISLSDMKKLKLLQQTLFTSADVLNTFTVLFSRVRSLWSCRPTVTTDTA